MPTPIAVNVPNRSDALLRSVVTLPGPGAQALSDPLDLGDHEGSMLVPVELLVELPAMTATQLPDAATISAEVQQSADGQAWEPVPLAGGVIAEGAGGVGQAARRVRWHPPADVKRFVRLAVDTGAGTAATGAEVPVRLVY